MTKHEILGDYDIVPRGSSVSVNPALEEQKALQRLMILAQVVKPAVDADPKARFEVDIAEAAVDWLQRNDMLMTDKILIKRSPEEQQAIIAQRQQQAAAQNALATNQPLSLGEMGKQAKALEGKVPAGKDQLVSI
jgi:hypothetical protein